MLKICIFSRAFYPDVGGLERIAQILAVQFSNAGHIVEVVTDTPAGLATNDAQFEFQVLRTNKAMERIRAFRRSDVVLTMNISLHGLLAAIMANARIVATHQSCYRVTSFRGRILENVKRYSMNFITNISCSAYVARQFRVDSTVIHNSYDDTLFIQASTPIKRSYDFVFCGRLVSDKGADICIRAFSNVLKTLPDATLTVIGDGPELLSYQALTKKLGVSEKVRFTGALIGKVLVAELQEHVCMVVTSLWEEPFGIVALEGVACCDTVIVSNRGGLPEAVGDCGLIVEPQVDELTDAMVSVAVAHREESVLMPGQLDLKKRKEHLAKHVPNVVAQQYLDVIVKAVGK